MKLKILKVTGNSMHPALKSGAFVLVLNIKYLTSAHSNSPKIPIISPIIQRYLSLRVGDIVAVNHPTYGNIIKRIKILESNVASQQQCRSKNEERSKYFNLSKYFKQTNYFKQRNNFNSKQQILRMRLCGDNPSESISEEAMGWVTKEDLIGKVIFKVKPK